MASRPKQGRAVLLMRDSRGEPRTVFGEYVNAAWRFAEREGLRFRGTAEQIQSMIERGVAVLGEKFAQTAMIACDQRGRAALREPGGEHFLVAVTQ